MRKESIQSKKILICLSICALCFILLPPLVSSADTGPHPSLYVSFVNLSDKLCYATVLSEEGIIGPLHAYWGTEETKIAFF